MRIPILTIIGIVLILGGLAVSSLTALAVMGCPTPDGTIGNPTPLTAGERIHVWVEVYDLSTTYYFTYVEIDLYNDGQIDENLSLEEEGYTYKQVMKFGDFWTAPPAENRDVLIRFRFFSSTKSGEAEKTTYGVVYGTGSPPPDVSVPEFNWTYPNGSQASPNFWSPGYTVKLQASTSDVYPVFVTAHIDVNADGTIDRVVYLDQETPSFHSATWTSPSEQVAIKFTFEAKNTLCAQATHVTYGQTKSGAVPTEPELPDRPVPTSYGFGMMLGGGILAVAGLVTKR